MAHSQQPTPRVVKLLKDAGVKLPRWVAEPVSDKQKSIKNVDKLRKNQPKEAAEEAPEVPAEEPATEAAEVETAEEAPAEEPVEEPAAEATGEADESK